MTRLVCMRGCAYDCNVVGTVDAVALCGECCSQLVATALDTPLMALVLLKRQVRSDHNHSGLNDLKRAWRILRSVPEKELQERFGMTPVALVDLVREAFRTLV